MSWLVSWLMGSFIGRIATVCKGGGKRRNIVAETLLLVTLSCARKLGNICCGTKCFWTKSETFFVSRTVPDTKFVRNKCCASAQAGKHLCRQQCVRNNVSLFARTLKKMWCCVGGSIRSNLVLSTELMMWIGHRKEIRKLTFRALAFRRSESRN